MMTFIEFLEAMRTAMPDPPHLSQATTFSLAFPGKEDTRRAIERARKLGRVVLPADLKVATSPESREAARQGALDISRPPLRRNSGKAPGPAET